MASYIGNAPTPKATQRRQSITAIAGQTSFMTSGYTPGFLDIYLNGVHLEPIDYTATDGVHIELAAECEADDILTYVSFTTFEVGDITGFATEAYVDAAVSNADVTDELATLTSNYQSGDSATLASAEAYTDTAKAAAISAASADATAKADAAESAANLYTDQSVADLIDSSPATLDTLNELASALGDDPNFAATVSAQIGTKADAVHAHSISQVTGLQAALNGKVDDSQVLTNVPSNAVFTDTIYTHPSYNGDDIDLDTGALSGATVISDLDFNVTTDTQGHVTDANATYSTRNITASNVGALPITGGTLTGALDFGSVTGRAITITGDSALDGADASIYLGNSPASYGFDITYEGSGSGNTNAFVIKSTNLNSPKELLRANQDGIVNLPQTGAKVGGNYIFHDSYHPNADKWTTPRTLSLTGDVTGSVSWDGSGNASLSANCVYADAAGSANSIDGIAFRNGNNSNSIGANSVTTNGMGYTSTGLFGQPDGALYSQAYSSSWVHQIYGDYRTGNMAVRGKKNGTWQSWKTVWTSGNDGSGSGLDADKLDGYHASQFTLASTFTATTTDLQEQIDTVAASAGGDGKSLALALLF
jgi:hypothetical protein